MYEINEYDELREVVVHVDERINLEQTNIDGKLMNVIHKGYTSRHLFEIERFVVDVVNDRSKCGFDENSKCSSKAIMPSEVAQIANQYRKVNSWLQQYSDLYRYSERVEAFYEACKSMGLVGQNHLFEFPLANDLVGCSDMRYMNLFNELIERVRLRCLTREFKERRRLRGANAERNRQNVLALENAMFDEQKGRSRWLIVSLTLRYKPRHREWITLDIIQKHRDRFFAARRFNKLMSGIKGYVWTIEQGDETGLHLHVVLFYSAESNHDEYIAMQIGEYWKNVVTEGKGDYWNSNDGKLKRRYEEYGHGVGVGQINWNDSSKREALRLNLIYLAKTEQYLMIKMDDGIRTFGMGQVPKKVKLGRPRIVDACL